jgi:hypothetical protein
LIAEGIRPESGRELWEHDFVQSRFSGQLVNRRKIYSADLRDALQQNQKLRNLADYAIRWPTDVQALRSLERTRRLVAEGDQRISR